MFRSHYAVREKYMLNIFPVLCLDADKFTSFADVLLASPTCVERTFPSCCFLKRTSCHHQLLRSLNGTIASLFRMLKQQHGFLSTCKSVTSYTHVDSLPSYHTRMPFQDSLGRLLHNAYGGPHISFKAHLANFKERHAIGANSSVCVLTLRSFKHDTRMLNGPPHFPTPIA